MSGCSAVCLSVCLSVLVTNVSSAKTDKPIEMPSGGSPRGIAGSSNGEGHFRGGIYPTPLGRRTRPHFAPSDRRTQAIARSRGVALQPCGLSLPLLCNLSLSSEGESMYRESISENAKHLLRRMRTVTREAKLPRICCTVAEKSSVTLSSGIGFQFVNSNVTTRSRVITALHQTASYSPSISHTSL